MISVPNSSSPPIKQDLHPDSPINNISRQHQQQAASGHPSRIQCSTSTTTNESRRLVGGLLSLHLPSTTTNESRRLVGGFFGLHLPSTTTNESSRLVGGFFGLHLPSTTTNESSRLVGGLLFLTFSFILILSV
jgi:hypothetical protein